VDGCLPARALPAVLPSVRRGHEVPISCAAHSPDCWWLVTGSEDMTARLWHLRLNELMDLARRTLGRESADKEMNSAGLSSRPG
jgi:WD40 repeat protein